MNDNEKTLFTEFAALRSLDENENAKCISFNMLWSKLGFHDKATAKKSFKKQKHEQENWSEISLPNIGEQNFQQHGGHNQKDIIMTLRCAQDFAIQCQTEPAKQIRSYFIKIEELIHNYLLSKANERIKQLQEIEYKYPAKYNNKTLYVKPTIFYNRDSLFLTNNVMKIGTTDSMVNRDKSYGKDNEYFNFAIDGNDRKDGLFIEGKMKDYFAACIVKGTDE